MRDDAPLLSIITATYNAAAVVADLLESLAAQSFRDFELVVQDGASTDRTVAQVRSFEGRLPGLSLESAPDTGIYDAWNKAVKRARGEWVLFLGADDSLHGPDCLEKAASILSATVKSVDYVGCSIVLTAPGDVPVETIKASPFPWREIASGMPVPHPALFHRRSLFSQREFSTSLKIAGDYEFLCSTLTHENYSCNVLVVTRMRMGGISGSLDSMLRSELECLSISRAHFPGAFPLKLYGRVCRSAIYRGIAFIAGTRLAGRFADIARKLTGKPAKWSKDWAKMRALSALPREPLVSLCIATLNREAALLRLVESLNAQSYENFEIIIGNQNDPGYLDTVLATVKSGIHVRCITIDALGVSQARNSLLPLAAGDIIAFPDDDCIYLPDTLREVVASFAANPHLSGTLVAWSDSKDDAGYVEEQVTKYSAFRDAGTLVQFYRKEALCDIFFDPELGPGTNLPYGCGEDTDYLLQVIKAGGLVARLEKVLVLHAKPDFNDKAILAKTHKYALGRMQLLRKHRLPFLFRLANLFYPLARVVTEGSKAWPYRKAMFLGRLKGFWS